MPFATPSAVWTKDDSFVLVMASLSAEQEARDFWQLYHANLPYFKSMLARPLVFQASTMLYYTP
ncbi:hypothetical protein KSB_65400 [Ktedonobacter robiniae]|uniref:EthD domain-containing protein n=1 Tax=Ktedonobacter robiniae TaxID=2778365 RepID=A0ABQ3UZD7_9CHLR|nr:hypothetical protein KSB_65400 [Ktedonobacter robiniae]